MIFIGANTEDKINDIEREKKNQKWKFNVYYNASLFCLKNTRISKSILNVSILQNYRNISSWLHEKKKKVKCTNIHRILFDLLKLKNWFIRKVYRTKTLNCSEGLLSFTTSFSLDTYSLNSTGENTIFTLIIHRNVQTVSNLNKIMAITFSLSRICTIWIA